MASFVTITYILTLIVSNFATSIISKSDAPKYEPNWESLDSRPLPSWYDEAKVGIFIHWGVFSVPSFGSEWFWSLWKDQKNEKYIDFMKNNYPEHFTYQEFAKDFTAEFFDAKEWADIFVKSGAKYVVLTSKHHGDTLCGLLNTHIAGIRKTLGHIEILLIIPEMKELVETYKPDILWSDGEWEATASYWNSTEFLAWLYNDSPVGEYVIVNDRWGRDTLCRHGDFFTCNDRYNPGILQSHKWENAMTIDIASWGFRREAKLADYYTPLDLISQIASTVSCGGNILINVGPTKEGTISPILEERLLQIGEWLSINGEAIYGTTPWTAQNDTLTWGVWYTSKGSAVYAIVLHWTWYANTLPLSSVMGLFDDRNTKVTMLGNEDDGNLEWFLSDAVYIKFPDKSTVKSEWAWVLKIESNSADNDV
ncbi:hypothetical protein NQ314_008035 [Rhamnusium bicolor]|uniref:alpha-L-fucosidase n=1 Tax=Rhamnusium bicolor TaxID=1586634 RepID=A0AAV8YES0_9CUCU|nr:hypothetical protein NQ314_008035 [Rhamnusium bicolor]